jgi:hypothetical protein
MARSRPVRRWAAGTRPTTKLDRQSTAAIIRFNSEQIMLYKYLNLDTDERTTYQEKLARLESLLLRGQCYFSKPGGFNDPDEFRFYVPPPTDMNALFAAMCRNRPNYTRAEFDQWVNGIPHDAWNMACEPLSEYLKDVGVFCLSRLCDSFPMWAHYAREHSGVCVGIDEDAFPGAAGFCGHGKVMYEKVPPTIQVIEFFGQDKTEVLRKVFFTKHKSWGYEKENRFLILDGGNLVTLPSTAIKRLMLGMKMSAPKEQAVLQIAAQRPAGEPLEVVKGTLTSPGYAFHWVTVPVP